MYAVCYDTCALNIIMFLEGWDQKEAQESIDLADMSKKLAGLNCSIRYQLMEHTNTLKSEMTKQNEQMATELQKQAEEISQLHSIVKEQAEILKSLSKVCTRLKYAEY